MTTVQRTQHAITTLFYPGCGGDRPEPWQKITVCLCGEEISFEEQGLSSPILSVNEAFEEHLESLRDPSEK